MAAKMKKKHSRKVFFSEALRRVLAQGPTSQLRSVPLLFRAALDEITFLVNRLIPAIPPTLLAFQSCDERNSSYHLYGCNRPGVLTVYVHGGAWGAGSARDFSALASRMARVFDGPVFVADQRLYPHADMLQQAADVSEVVREAQRRYPDRKSVLVGHSSGAHSSAIALANGSTQVDAAVLQAGVYDPLAHFLHEGTRGVESVSPMAPAADADRDVLRLSDYAIPQFFLKEPNANGYRNKQSASFDTFPQQPANLSHIPLQGDREARHIGLPKVAAASVPWGAALGTFVMTAAEDTVVPLSSSLRFLKSLRSNGIESKFLLYTGTQHVDFVFDWIKDRPMKEGALDVDSTDETRRRTAFTVLHGKVAAELKVEALHNEVPLSEHARDLYRIFQAVSSAV